MTTVHTPWPSQLILPGQVAAPQGPVDMFMMYLMHHAFRRDLTAFAAVVPRTPVDDRRTWGALADRWALFADALHSHHFGEDAWLWPALLDRCSDADRGTLEAMEHEHEGIDPLLQASAEGFATMAAGADEVSRGTLASQLTAARDSLARHLAHEETDAMRILQETFGPADWQAIDEKFKEAASFGKVVRLVPWALYGVPSGSINDIFGRTGAVHRLIWNLTRRRFAQAEARAFRYA